MEYHHLEPHNSAVLVASETGLLGLLLWGALIAMAFRKLTAVERMHLGDGPQEEALKRMALGLKVALAGFLVTAMFGNQGYNPLLFLFLGVPHAIEAVARDYECADATEEAAAPECAGADA